MKDNYLCMKGSERRAVYLAVRHSLAPPRHLYLPFIPSKLSPPSPPPLFSCIPTSLPSSGLGYPIRLWNKPAKGRLTTPIREDRAASPLPRALLRGSFAARRRRAWTSFRRTFCKQRSSSLSGTHDLHDIFFKKRRRRRIKKNKTKKEYK